MPVAAGYRFEGGAGWVPLKVPIGPVSVAVKRGPLSVSVPPLIEPI